MTCQRDAAYVRAALQLSHRKDFKGAISLVEKIHDLDTRAQTLQFVSYDLTAASLEKKTPEGLGEALRNAERLTSPEQQGLLFIRLADSWRANGDRDRAHALLLAAGRSSERVAEPGVRAGLLFTAAYELSDLDPGLIQTIRMMKDAIRLVNENKEVRIDQINVLRRLDVGCEKKDGTWYGSSDQVGRFDLIATLVKIAGSDTDMAEELAHEFTPGSNRIRALAAIAAWEIKSIQTTAKASARRG